MAKEEAIKLDGVVLEVLPNAMFKVEVNGTSHQAVAHISGKMRQHSIKVIAGDKVELEFSPYDLSKGRVVRRL